jgi:membrane associated rhomboid family serine protease
MRSTRQTSEFQWPPVTPAVRVLLIMFITAFVVETIYFLVFPLSVGYVSSLLALSFGQFFHPVQILTHIFLSSAPGMGGVFSLLIKSVTLWMFGSELERLWGSANFIKFFISGLAGGALLAFGVSLVFLPDISVSGYDAGLTSLLIAFAMIWPDRQVYLWGILPVTMKWLVLIIMGMLFLSGSVNSMILHSGGALAGALTLLVYAKQGRIYSGYLMNSATPGKKFSIIDYIKKFNKKRRLARKQAVINERIDMKDRVDLLLDKISKQGIGSLTKKEKVFLDEAANKLNMGDRNENN